MNIRKVILVVLVTLFLPSLVVPASVGLGEEPDRKEEPGKRCRELYHDVMQIAQCLESEGLYHDAANEYAWLATHPEIDWECDRRIELLEKAASLHLKVMDYINAFSCYDSAAGVFWRFGGPEGPSVKQCERAIKLYKKAAGCLVRMNDFHFAGLIYRKAAIVAARDLGDCTLAEQLWGEARDYFGKARRVMEIPVEVEKCKEGISVSTDKPSYVPPEEVNVTANVRIGEKLIEGAEVSGKVEWPDGAIKDLKNFKPKGDGKYTASYILEESFPDGTYKIKVEAKKDGLEGSGEGSFEVGKPTIEIEVSPQPLYISKEKQYLEIKVTVKDTNNQPMEDVLIECTLTDPKFVLIEDPGLESLDKKWTDENGVVTFKVPMPTLSDVSSYYGKENPVGPEIGKVKDFPVTLKVGVKAGKVGEKWELTAEKDASIDIDWEELIINWYNKEIVGKGVRGLGKGKLPLETLVMEGWYIVAIQLATHLGKIYNDPRVLLVMDDYGYGLVGRCGDVSLYIIWRLKEHFQYFLKDHNLLDDAYKIYEISVQDWHDSEKTIPRANHISPILIPTSKYKKLGKKPLVLDAYIPNRPLTTREAWMYGWKHPDFRIEFPQFHKDLKKKYEYLSSPSPSSRESQVKMLSLAHSVWEPRLQTSYQLLGKQEGDIQDLVSLLRSAYEEVRSAPRISFDKDKNGKAELLLLDINRDGLTEVSIVVDFDGDGMFDLVVMDFNEGGRLNIQMNPSLKDSNVFDTYKTLIEGAERENPDMKFSTNIEELHSDIKKLEGVEPGIPFQDDFSKGLTDEWIVVDDPGVVQDHSHWHVSNEVLVQDSNICDVPAGHPHLDLTHPYLGTHIYAGNSAWINYTFSTRLKPIDNDGMGVLFRYIDKDNYYRFFMMKDKGNGGPFRALQKKVAGKTTTLKSDKWEYKQNTWYKVSVKVSGSNIKVYMDDDPVFDVTDSSFPQGKIALYTWGMGDAAHFDDVVVRSLGAPPEWKVIRGDWDISPDRMSQKSLRNWHSSLDGAILINTKYSDLRSFSIEADGRLTEKVGAGHWGFVYGFKDEKNFNTLYCRVHQRHWTAWSMVDGKFTGQHKIPFKISAYGSHHLRLDVDYDLDRYDVFVDGEKIGSIPEAQVRHEGGKVGLIAWDPAEFRNVKITAVRAALLGVLPTEILFQDDFSKGLTDKWTVVDDPGVVQDHSNWHVSKEILVQDSNTCDASPGVPYDGLDAPYSGTHIYAGNSAWTNYTFSARLKPIDNDGIGVLFRYTDKNNYYRFFMVKDKATGGPFRALQKRVAGKFTTLKSDKWEYEQNTWYEVRVKASGSSIKVYMDDDLVFQVSDDSLPRGKIALYTWGMGNPAAHFDDVIVRGVAAAVPEVSEETAWNVIRGDWDISPDGILQKNLRDYHSNLDGATLVNTKYVDLRSFSIEANGRLTEKVGAGHWGFVYGFKDEKNFNTLYCRVHQRHWTAWSMVDGKFTGQHKIPFKISAYGSHHLRLDVDYDLDRYDVFVDGEKIGSIPEAQVRHEGGKVGLIAWDPAELRNVKITALGAPLKLYKDTFRLSTGEVIFGELLSFDGNTLKIKTEEGVIEKRREEIVGIWLGVGH